MLPKKDDAIITMLKRCNKETVLDDVDGLKRHINSMIRGNLLSLAACAAAIAICVVLIGYLVLIITNVVGAYFYANKQKSLLDPFSERNADENYDYRSATAAELPPVPENVVLSDGMRRLQAKYSLHNQYRAKMVDPTDPNAIPDDVVDETILARPGDNYAYGAAADPAALAPYQVPARPSNAAVPVPWYNSLALV